MQNVPVPFIESPLFMEWAADVWSPEEKAAFMGYLASNPTVGVVVPGTCGMRKVRWSVAGRGKSYGVRVIYYFANVTTPIYLVYGYSKTEKADLSQQDKKSLKEAVTRIKKTWSLS